MLTYTGKLQQALIEIGYKFDKINENNKLIWACFDGVTRDIVGTHPHLGKLLEILDTKIGGI